jgi:hypothetical protein
LVEPIIIRAGQVETSLPAPPFYLATIVIPAKAGIQHPSIGGYSVVKVRLRNFTGRSQFLLYTLSLYICFDVILPKQSTFGPRPSRARGLRPGEGDKTRNRFAQNTLLSELNERKTGKNDGDIGQHSLDLFCKTAKK